MLTKYVTLCKITLSEKLLYKNFMKKVNKIFHNSEMY